jgi:multiple sugar transport system substrate-binding protein
MHSYRALTWDHPRGYNALVAAAAALDPVRDGLSIAWDKQPLDGFESHSIADLCSRYDLVVLDHPHIGEAVEADCLVPLEDVFGTETIAVIGAETIGPWLSSYRFADKHWALPLDAATQVMAARADLLGAPSPETWDEVLALSNGTGKVALSLAGPHAILSFLSIAVALGKPPAERDPDLFVSPETGRQVLDLLVQLVANSPRGVREKNPIGILGHMAANEDVILCPLIYGYVNYAAPTSGKSIRFSNAPRMGEGGRPGSTLGGIGISKRCAVTPELKNYLLWLMSTEAQTTFIPAHDGQPSRRSAWADASVNARWNDFYRNTADTLEAAYVRPRHSGYIAFQGMASALLRQAINERRPAGAVLDGLQALYRASRPKAG